MATRRLYDEDAYRRTFFATVISCEKTKSGYAVILDQTAFFPEEGGQTPDRGTLRISEGGDVALREGALPSPAADSPAVMVTDVQIADECITHFCDTSLTPGVCVLGEIDWAHRYSNMQQHTGEHIFSGVVHDALGYENVGFHLSDNIVTMDYDGPLSVEQIAEFERISNEWIFRNVAVSARYPSDEELRTISYRSKEGITGAVRIVTIEGCDVCACCAPHVARTGEVGILKVIDHTPYKGGVRLSILCGMRALNDYGKKLRVQNDLSRLLSKPEDELYTRVEGLLVEREEYRQKLYAAKQQLLELMIANTAPDAENVCLFLSDCDMNLARKTVNDLTAGHRGFCTICVGSDADGYSFILGSAAQKANEAATLLRTKLSAKCGGSDAMIRGSIHAPKEAIEAVLG